MCAERRRHRIASATLVGALVGAMLGGCAHTYTDAGGNRHIVGLVNLTLPAESSERKAADWIRMRTVGLALSRTDIGSALELGYSDNTLAVVRNNSCVQLARLPTTLFSSPGVVHAPEPVDR